jgi:hypothetical protein
MDDRNHGQLAERSVWDRRSGALLKHRGMLVFDVFKGHLRANIKTATSNLHTEEQPFSHRLVMLRNHSKSDHVTCIGNACYMGTANQHQQENPLWRGLKSAMCQTI